MYFIFFLARDSEIKHQSYNNVPPFLKKHGQQFSIQSMNSANYLINITALINNSVTRYLSCLGRAIVLLQTSHAPQLNSSIKERNRN